MEVADDGQHFRLSGVFSRDMVYCQRYRLRGCAIGLEVDK